MFGRSDPTSAAPKTPLFPIFLLPSIPIPFGRRRREADTTSVPAASSSSSSSSPPRFRGRPFPSLSSSSAASDPPSLCTSPVSTGSTPPSSPTSPTSLFPAFGYAPAADLGAAVRSHPPRPALTRPLPDTIRCATCATDIAFAAQIVSKGFTGRHGRAYLVSAPPAASTPSCPPSPAESPGPALDLVNIRIGRSEHRQLVTGAHVVADISCVVCGTKVGWKYVDAKEAAQKYKVGKFILETARVVGSQTWEDGFGDDGSAVGVPARARGSVDASWFANRDGDLAPSPPARGVAEEDDDGEVIFDSDDEDECEDIFAGTWDADLVAKRRKGKVAALKKKQRVV